MGAVNSERVGGIDTYVIYKTQTAYTTAVTPDTIFGGLVRSAKFGVDRQYNERTGFVGTNAWDGRATAQHLAGTVVTSGSVEFDVQRWDWFQHVLLGTRTGDGSAGDPYVYDVGRNNGFLTVSEEIDNEATDSHRVYPGMVINSCDLNCSVGEPLTASVSLLGGQLTKTTTVIAKIANLADDVYNFSGGSIELPSGTPLSNVIDSVSVSINNNYTPIYGFNEEAKNAKPGKLNLKLSFTLKYLDDTLLNQLLGSSTVVGAQSVVDLKLKFTKPNTKSAELLFKDIVINKVDTSHNLNEFVTEDVDITPKRITLTEVV
jgi:hypothetical protein